MLDPEAKAVLDDLARKTAVQVPPRDAAQRLAQARAMTGAMADYSGEAPAGVSARDIDVPGPAGPVTAGGDDCAGRRAGCREHRLEIVHK